MADLCQCGCGEVVVEGRKFRHGHYARTPAARAGYTSRRQTIEVANPDGLCLCGCGQPTPIATTNRPERGYYKGQHVRYCPGHQVPFGADNPAWKGGRYQDAAGYIHIHRPDDPVADRYGYVLEHRAVAAETLGRPLRADEDVHHINGIKDDNRPENLVALTKSAHHRLHGTKELDDYHAANPEAKRESGRRGAAARWGKKS